MIERALFVRALRWADGVPEFFTKWTAGDQAHAAFAFLGDYLPTAAEEQQIPGLGPGAVHWLVVHVVRHLQPFFVPCNICSPLPPGVKVGPDGSDAGTIRVYGAAGVISPGHVSIQWRAAKSTTPAALEKLKQYILRGDLRQAEIDRLAAADGGLADGQATTAHIDSHDRQANARGTVAPESDRRSGFRG